MISLVSVIIPVFNRFEYADRSIRSVLNQTYSNWELYVVDDCSEDAYLLPVECENFPQNIVLLRNEINAGPGLSRQKGLDLAKGEFVCFLDSDDYWLPGFLEKSLETHNKSNFTIGATYCQSKMTDGTLRRRNEIEDEVDDIFFGVVSGARPWATCSLMWNRNHISTWTNLRTNQDAYFEIGSALKNPKIVFIPYLLCVIDKKTSFNADDLVDIIDSNKNRLITLLFAQSAFDKYNGTRKYDSHIFLIKRSLSKAKSLIKTRYLFFGFISFFKTLIFKLKFRNGV
jgi:glycosyltransferase involved in cell wall biosynthesis